MRQMPRRDVPDFVAYNGGQLIHFFRHLDQPGKEKEMSTRSGEGVHGVIFEDVETKGKELGFNRF